jgi:hypothetical protein
MPACPTVMTNSAVAQRLDKRLIFSAFFLSNQRNENAMSFYAEVVILR